MRKALEIKKNKYGLRVFCKTCDRLYYHNTVKRCKHDSSCQTYKSIVYLPDGSTRSKHFSVNNYDSALVLAIEFKNRVKSSTQIYHSVIGRNEDPNQISILDAANLFLNFKHDIGVQPHQKRNLSKNYLSSVELYLRQFVESVRGSGYSVEHIPVSKIDDKMVGVWYTLITEHYSKGSWNAPIRVLRLWIDYMINKQRVSMSNPFLDAKLIQHENEVEIITASEFEAVCKAVDKASPWAEFQGKTTKRKSRYRDFLVDSFKLAVFTGLRREELLTLTWQDLHFVNADVGYMIITDNLKVERITKAKYKKKYIPVGEELKSCLLELGWEEKKNSSEYIIAPERNVSVVTLMNDCSKGFTHYYKQAFPGKRAKQMKVLRKTYLTQLARSVGDDIIHFSSHSGTKVLEDHYFDKKLLVKGVGMRIFS